MNPTSALKLLRIVQPIALGLIALLWVTDVINQTTFIIMLVIETVISMGLTIYLTRMQRELARNVTDLQDQVGAPIESRGIGDQM